MGQFVCPNLQLNIWFLSTVKELHSISTRRADDILAFARAKPWLASSKQICKYWVYINQTYSTGEWRKVRGRYENRLIYRRNFSWFCLLLAAGHVSRMWVRDCPDDRDEQLGRKWGRCARAQLNRWHWDWGHGTIVNQEPGHFQMASYHAIITNCF